MSENPSAPQNPHAVGAMTTQDVDRPAQPTTPTAKAPTPVTPSPAAEKKLELGSQVVDAVTGQPLQEPKKIDAVTGQPIEDGRK